MNYLYGTDEYWENMNRMANWAQLWTFMMESEDLKVSEIAAMLSQQNQDYLEIIMIQQKEILERLARLEEKMNGE